MEPTRGLEPAKRPELVEGRLRYAARRAVLSGQRAAGEPTADLLIAKKPEYSCKWLCCCELDSRLGR
jgi:hypothetical protein